MASVLLNKEPELLRKELQELQRKRYEADARIKEMTARKSFVGPGNPTLHIFSSLSSHVTHTKVLYEIMPVLIVDLHRGEQGELYFSFVLF